MKKIFITLLFVLVLSASVFGAFLIGVYYGSENRPAVEKITDVYNKEVQIEAEIDFAPFWEAWKILDERYVDTHATSTDKKITNQDRVWGAISGLTRSLDDPYTIFLPPEEKKEFEADIQGKFSGVGMEVDVRDGNLVVVSPLPNTPAKKAGILPGDRIIRIDDFIASDLSLNEAVRKIRGDRGTTVKLTVAREGVKDELKFDIIRDTIEVPVIETELLPNKIFVIRLFSFSASSPKLFKEALKEFATHKTNKLIFDLRGNPGGYLDAAISISSWFLPEDKVVLREMRGEGEVEQVHYSLGYDAFSDKLKMVILVDQGSASASEIVAGALAENGKATLIGQKTFGKGSVQELIPLTDDTSLKVTIARWFTPKGHSISENGLNPDIVVERTAKDIKEGKDPQLERAISFLLK